MIKWQSESIKGGCKMKQILIKMIKGYQYWISPMLGSNCRYTPTCSSYAILSIEYHGVLKGMIMGIARILRCHPFVKGGFDPVPDKFSLRRNVKI